MILHQVKIKTQALPYQMKTHNGIGHREAASGSVVELRLEQANSYMMNIQQGDFELIDFELGGIRK